MRDRGRGDVGAGHPRGATGQERAAVTLAARDVEHVAPGDDRQGEMVAMPVLVPDLARGAGNEALAGERQGVVHADDSTRAVRSAPARDGAAASAITMNTHTSDQ